MFERYTELATESECSIPSSYLSRTANFKETLSRYIGDTYEFVVLRNAAPTERQTLLLPFHFRHVPLADTVHDQNPVENIAVFKQNDEDFLSLVHVALKLRNDITSHPGSKGVDVNEKEELASIPSSVGYTCL